MTENPWRDITPPTAEHAISARRVDADLRWDFFWARDVHGSNLLVLGHSPGAAPTARLPLLQGLEIVALPGSADGPSMLAFRLLDAEHSDIFQQLCRDIVESSRPANSEREAVEIALARTWRWHHLLRGGNDGRLSPEEQKGLLGELLVLERHLLTNLPARDAVAAWRGPLDAPRDFEIGRIGVESKARRGDASAYVHISSEHQLDDSGLDALFLHVAEFARASSDDANAFDVIAVAARVRSAVERLDAGALDLFEGSLLATGFVWDDDYADSRWTGGDSRLYRVAPEFPRISPLGLAAGITAVRYSLSLAACDPFVVAHDALHAMLKGGSPRV